jgi:hypothetical protein
MKRVIQSFRSINYRKLHDIGLIFIVSISVYYGCDAAGDGGCVAFETAPCECFQGSGEKICLADGSGYGECICSPLVNSGAGGETMEAGSSGIAFGSGGVQGDFAAGTGGTGAVLPVNSAGGETTGGTGGEPAGGTSGSSGDGSGNGTAGTTGGEDLPLFSFFLTSLEAIQRLSGSPNGFGGDLRYGEADGLSGADKICTEIAEYSMPGAKAKQWRAFLSTTTGGANGGPVHAIERIGTGPWYDRLGRIVAENTAALTNSRPEGADPAIINDLPNEYGVPNHAPDGVLVDNHDILTGSGADGRLYGDARSTCQDWTSSVGTDGNPRCGHSWPRGGGGRGGRFGGFSGTGGMAHWISALDEAGCAPGVNLIETGGPNPFSPTVGSGGGYGGFYCFALAP